MKYTICSILLFAAGCSETQSNLEVVAVQHIGKGIINDDECLTLYREDGNAVVTPHNFKITPFEAIEIAKEKLKYACGNKLGTKILSDGKAYHIVSLGVAQDAIIINGMNGTVESKGFMERGK
jgi:hypothetical protein